MLRNDLTGKVFSRLTVVRFSRISGKTSKWICRCECGNEKEIFSVSLVSGETKSCGCFRREYIAKKNLTHGQSKLGKITPEYRTWANMHDRCNNPNNKRYASYGGAGIKVCKRWSKFEKFFEDMGERPTSQHSIDRIDNNKGYCKSNCRWKTMHEQQSNKKSNVNLTIDGVTGCVNFWAKKSGVLHSTIRRRIARGMDHKSAVFGNHISPSEA